MSVEPRKALSRIKDYVPAKSIESVKRQYGIDTVIKLAGNENSLGCSPLVKEKLIEAFDTLSYYPDMNCTKLREKLAGIHQIKEEQIVFANGSFELISLIAQTFLEEDDEVINIEPSFGWYKNVSLQMGANIINVPLKDFKADLEGVLQNITQKTKLIWLCNPNNPVGSILTHKQVKNFLDKLPSDILLVLDEAYVDYIDETDAPNFFELLREYHNIISLRTFSKVYGLASFRLGYAVSSEEITGYINKVRIPVNVNALAQIAALSSLEDQEFRNQVIENNKRGVQLYYKELDELGLKYVRTNCNFIFFDIGIDTVKVEQEYLKRGIIVRTGVEFGYPTWLRITIGKYEENVLVIDILKEILKGENL